MAFGIQERKLFVVECKRCREMYLPGYRISRSSRSSSPALYSESNGDIYRQKFCWADHIIGRETSESRSTSMGEMKSDGT